MPDSVSTVHAMRELGERLLCHPHPEGPTTAQLFVGRLPDPLRIDVPLPAAAVLLGSLLKTLAGRPATMEAVATQSLGPQRLTMTLLSLFAGVALFLAMIGIYGAVAYTVEQRTGEIGVRMALGAQARDVLKLVVGQGMKPVLFGLAVGLIATFGLGRLITAQLYQVSAQNPVLLSAVIVALTLVALIACLLPARRATLVDPIQALRTE